MTTIRDVAQLEALYGAPGRASLIKVADHITDEYAAWIGAARFCVLSTVGPSGTDGSPRGDDGPVVQIQDPKTLLLPDWQGNNRMDSLRNIVEDGRVSLMFMIAGQTNVIRLNGSATLSLDETLINRFEQGAKHPRSIVVIDVDEVYSQCARAVMRAGLWDTPPDVQLPTMGDILKAQENGAFDGADYDQSWAARAKKTMW